MTEDEFSAAFAQNTDLDYRSFQSGFLFALIIRDAMGEKAEGNELASFLKELAAGNVTLVESPLDTIREVERRTKQPVPEHIREFIVGNATGEIRQHSDNWHKWGALALLRVMGPPPSMIGRPTPKN